MNLKSFKPITSSMRGLLLVDRSDLSKSPSCKHLIKGAIRSSGRNNRGRITSYHRGGGHKRCLRIIKFNRSTEDKAEIVSFDYDPNRSANLCRMKSLVNGREYYIIAPDGVSVGDILESGSSVDLKPGCCMNIGNIPSGVIVHNIEMTPGKGGQIARSAGSYATVMGKHGKYSLIKLNSGETRYVLANCMATIGSVGNSYVKNICIAKAGRNRWKNKRPHVRGVAMNPVDHPMGGGEGKSAGGRHPVNRYGFSAKGKKTRKKKTYSDKFIKIKRKSS